MSINISTLEDGILEVVYPAETVTPEALARHRALVSAAVEREDVRKVLIDTTALPEMPSIVSAVEHHNAIAADKSLRKTRFAVVCSKLGVNERDLETTAVNRGVHMQCFTDRQMALAWLSARS